MNVLRIGIGNVKRFRSPITGSPACVNSISYPGEGPLWRVVKGYKLIRLTITRNSVFFVQIYSIASQEVGLGKLQLVEKMSHFRELSDEMVILLLTYLRAKDLSVLRLVNKVIFSEFRVSNAICYQIQNLYTIELTGKTQKSSVQETYSPEILYVKEIRSLLAAINSPQPPNGKGFLIHAY